MIDAKRRLDGRTFEWVLIYSGLAFFVSLYLRETMGGWGGYYFATVLAVGALHYFRSRGAVEWMALGIVSALAGAEFRSRQQLAQHGLTLLAGTIAAGIAWMIVRRSHFARERENVPQTRDYNVELWAIGLGILLGLGLSIRNGLKGWFNIYRGNEDYWSGVLWRYLGPTYLALLILGAVLFLMSGSRRRPSAYAWVWVVLIVQNAIAQLITGPLTQWRETAFSIYYVLLFAITAVIVVHYRWRGGTLSTVANHRIS